MTATIDELIASLMDRAMDGDLEAAKLVLAQPRRINITPPEDGGGFDARSTYRSLWDALVEGRLSVQETRDMLDVLQRVERYL
jgi:hypothetical protein